MGSYEQLKEAIKAVIKTNGKQEITGQVMQDTLLAITSSFGQGALFAGIATPETNPLTPDQNVFYLASKRGVYPNFNSLSVNEGEIVVFSLSNGQWTKQLLSLGGGGSVTIVNEPDEEDLTTVPQTPEKNVIRFKNRIYDETNASGKGYKILRKYWKEVNGVRKNILTQDMINDANTIYEIRYDFDLNGAEIQIKEGCVLNFVGGSFKNGTIIFNDTCIKSSLIQIFKDISCKGSVISDMFVEYFGTIPNNPASVDLKESLENIYNVCSVAKLGSGRFYTNYSSIEIKNLIGVGRDSTFIEFSNIENNNTGFRFGKTSGGAENRTWNNYIFGLQIEIKENGSKCTSVLEINNVTRAVIENITLINYNKREQEYTAEELVTPESYSNYALLMNGISELVDISKFTFVADIPIYSKKSCDLLSFRKGYIECSSFGFAGIYGSPLGPNSEISGGVDIAQGLYGMYFTSVAADSFRTNYSNIRIEQLRGNGANVYINASNSVLDLIIKGLSLSANTKGFKIDGMSKCSIYLNNIICYNDSILELFDITNPNAEVTCENFSVNEVKPFNNYSIGVNIYSENAYIIKDNFKICPKRREDNYFANKMTIIGDVIRLERPISNLKKGYTASILNSKLFKNLSSLLLKICIYDSGVIACIRYKISIIDGKFKSINTIEDNCNLSRFISIGINADFYIDITNNTEYNLVYSMNGLSFTATYFLPIIDYMNHKGTTRQRPTLTNADDGFEYYDTALMKKILWNGIAWVNMDGTAL